MEQLRDFGDERVRAFCAYCGGSTETKDHVPSKILLDEPYPSNLPVVPACEPCNQSFSEDEAYLACLLECVSVGSTSGSAIKRDKIRRHLRVRPEMASLLAQARIVTGGQVSFKVETERIRNVALKLARGHAAFEIGEPQYGEPKQVSTVPLLSMTDEALMGFEKPPQFMLWPEVGSRGMQRIVSRGNEPVEKWIVVQPGRYRYLASSNRTIRIVIGEYLACEVIF